MGSRYVRFTCTLCKHISFRHKSLSFFAAKLAQWLHLRLATAHIATTAHSYAAFADVEDDAPGR